MTDGNFGNVSAGVLFSKVAYLSVRISSYARGKFGQHERSVRVARLRNENVDKQNQNTHVEVNIFVQNFHIAQKSLEILQLF